MKNLSIILVLLMSFFSVKSQVTKHVNAEEFKKLVDSKQGIVLDVRTPQEVAKGHIDGATTIDLSDRAFVEKIKMMQKDKPIYVYCLSGSRSRTAARILEQNGFKEVYNLSEGIISWYRAGYPLVAGSTTVNNSDNNVTQESINNTLKSNKIVFMDFNATWCAPCKTMMPIVEKLESENKNIKVLKIDVSENQDIAEAYGVQSIPYFILYKNGNQVWQKTGVVSFEEMNSVVKNKLN